MILDIGYEQYDANLQQLHQDIGKIQESNNNIHFEFRKTYLETEKKQNLLSNDISMIKNALKIPPKDTPPQVYLQSDFFKSRLNNIRARTRQNRQVHHIRSKTNFFFSKNQNVKERQILQANSECWQNSFAKNREYINESKQSKNCVKKFQINQEIQVCNQGVQSESIQPFIQREYIENIIKQLEQTFDQKIKNLQGIKKQCDWNHINFDQLHRYIDQHIIQKISQKVSISYFQTSLNNLKQAWENEQKILYERLSSKLQAQDIQTIIKQKLKSIWQQLEIMKQISFGKRNKNNLNHSLNKSCNLPIQFSSHRNTFKQEKSVQKRARGQNQTQLKNINFSNSLSVLNRSGSKIFKATNIDYLNSDVTNFENTGMSDKVWRQKVKQVLYEGKIAKKSKNRC